MIPAAAVAANTVSEADYPRDALLRGEQGVVIVSFRVDRDGYPELCRVAQSSGHPSLDRASCRLVIDRFIFKPKPGAASPVLLTKRIRWQIAQDQRDQVRQPAGAPATASVARPFGWLVLAMCGAYLLSGATRIGRGPGLNERTQARIALSLGQPIANDAPVLGAMLLATLTAIAALLF